MSSVLSRRGFVVAGAAAFCATEAAAQTLVQLPVSATRKADVTVWTPKGEAAGVLLFSHGHGSWPDRYAALVAGLTGAGYAVVAPLHVDSVRHADRAKYGAQASFAERLADMKAASAYAAKRWPGAPVAAVGHSFGTLIGLCLGGALAYLAPFRDPSVKAVLGYSTPGRIPGLVQPAAYASLKTPMMIVTGDNDVVPGFATDPADHLFPVRTAPAGAAFGLVLEGAAHDLAGGQPAELFRRGRDAGLAFLAAYVRDDAEARAQLLARTDAPPERWIVR
ncbi:alpha/beta hydrolase family protein [Phenylobacterium sp. VNQ135]|uniref:alpha/beta hydrolase family protein n=1 Tax=Phenylobacterium sp. VNQ135 TaxID=3400922 RepID=UPI003BFE9456